MTAAMYLLHAVHKNVLTRCILLFEGLVSFKSKRTEDIDHAVLLKNVIKNPNLGKIYSPQQLKNDSEDKLLSAFLVAGFDCGIPAVIEPEPC